MGTREDEIAARLAAATPGPWRTSWDDPTYPTPEIESGSASEWLIESDAKRVVAMTYYDGYRLACTREDAALLANAPTDLGHLLERVREAEAERDAAREELRADRERSHVVIEGLRARMAEVEAEAQTVATNLQASIRVNGLLTQERDGLLVDGRNRYSRTIEILDAHDGESAPEAARRVVAERDAAIARATIAEREREDVAGLLIEHAGEVLIEEDGFYDAARKVIEELERRVDEALTRNRVFMKLRAGYLRALGGEPHLEGESIADATKRVIDSLRARAEAAEAHVRRASHLHRTKPEDALDRKTIRSVAEDNGFVHAADVLRLLADVEAAEALAASRPEISAEDAAAAADIRASDLIERDSKAHARIVRVVVALRAHAAKAVSRG